MCAAMAFWIRRVHHLLFSRTVKKLPELVSWTVFCFVNFVVCNLMFVCVKTLHECNAFWILCFLYILEKITVLSMYMHWFKDVRDIQTHNWWMLRFWSVAPEAKSSSFQPLVKNPLLRNWTDDGLCREGIKHLLKHGQTETNQNWGQTWILLPEPKWKAQWEIELWTKTKTSSNKQLNHEWRRPVVMPELENWMDTW